MNTRQYFFLGAIGAIGFVLAFGLGSFVIALTNIPVTGGFISGLIVWTILTIGLKSVPKFGAATVLALVVSVLAIPTIILGPPGIYKIIVGLIAGLLCDLTIWLFKQRNAGYILGNILANEITVIGVYVAAIILGLPAAEKMKPVLLILLGVYPLIGLITGYMGLKVYKKKLINLSLFKRLAE